ncbi:MAG: MBL fold metallo-hydrolase [Oscillospiraceae bacterium]|nr:MBL fold metallo-hydrolase [Oscillospiraceae bacterium]
MKIKVLMENTTELPGFQTEHGLSLYLEACGHKILFDTGQSGAFAENAKKLDVDLSAVDLAVLSHGHYDHGGGLKTFLAINDQAPVYLSRHAFEEHRDAAGKDIGLDPQLEGNSRLVYTDEYRKLDEGLELFSCNGREQMHKAEPFGLAMRLGGVLLPEDFRHEQYLLLTENGRRVLLSGCSHKGVLNLVEWFSPDVLVGGFHFMKLDPAGDGRPALDIAARELARRGTIYYTCHCTGSAQYEYLKAQMKDDLHSLPCGQELVI